MTSLSSASSFNSNHPKITLQHRSKEKCSLSFACFRTNAIKVTPDLWHHLDIFLPPQKRGNKHTNPRCICEMSCTSFESCDITGPKSRGLQILMSHESGCQNEHTLQIKYLDLVHVKINTKKTPKALEYSKFKIDIWSHQMQYAHEHLI